MSSTTAVLSLPLSETNSTCPGLGMKVVSELLVTPPTDTTTGWAVPSGLPANPPTWTISSCMPSRVDTFDGPR